MFMNSPDGPACLQHWRLGREAEGQVLELRHAMSQPDGQLIVQELRGQYELPLDRVCAKVQHVLQAHPCNNTSTSSSTYKHVINRTAHNLGRPIRKIIPVPRHTSCRTDMDV